MLNDHVYEVFKLEEEDLAAIVIDRPSKLLITKFGRKFELIKP